MQDRVLVRNAVFEELERRRASSREFVTAEREEQAKACIRRYRAAHGCFPSRVRYDQWLDQLAADEQRGLLTSNQIRRALGSWARALEASGSPVSAGVLVRRYRAQGSKFTSEEILDSLRRWAESTPANQRLTFNRYRAWVDEQPVSPPDGGARLVASIQTIHNHFGSWRGALTAAGLDPDQGRARSGDWTRERVIDLLRVARTRVPAEQPLTLAQFRRACQALRSEAEQRGESFAEPSVAVTQRLFGSWRAALLAADVAGEDHPARSRPTVAQFSEMEIQDAITTFARERRRICGPSGGPSKRDYERWRSWRLRRDPGVPIPCTGVLVTRRGSWTACRAEIQAIPDLEPRR
jgi:hypothetical protein